MKFLGALFAWMTAAAALAGEIGIDWTITDASCVSCRVYYGTSSRAYTSRVEVGLTNHAIITGLDSGIQYFFAITDTDANGAESDFSTELTAAIPAPPAPNATEATIYFGPFTMRESGDLTNWTTNTIAGFFAVPLAASNHYFQVLLPGTDASIPVKITFSP